ncbi:MAG: lysophospholipid acyltransferase family protein [Thermosynechococcus sp. Uc]|uniref:lysophospholipid acyltransferase family protein n=1 Tax=Thermosynechococcus sp. Uc TaxID=3034853 RepID=UPI0019E53186|nr:lysophospholipid acyltransferase family protein [Thermosynechococcus sp. Uc]MDM7325963.1 lysophospholipid acyltransferase family protein [Thermosynechococcus sp. Uc]HIK24779.1 1-acyl-sn-glycerol-3-phosphate acyltransferase [Thermosynechococcus sp. M46_R2017_013]
MRHSAKSPLPHISPLLTPLMYRLLGDIVLQQYFRYLEVHGQEQVPKSGPVILAPTHRSRWDALIIPYVTGRRVSGRDLYYMVSHDEMLGLQGWVIGHCGGFAVNTQAPAVSALRTGVELLRRGQALVVFPEGNIFRDRQIHPLKPGLARLALQAARRCEEAIQIVPILLDYAQPYPQWGSDVKVIIGAPLSTGNYDLICPKSAAQQLIGDLFGALQQLQEGRSLLCLT